MKKEYHRHIDNGGITVEVSYMASDLDASLSMSADYFGYPAVSTTLQGLTKQDLREIGLMLLNFAADMNDYEKE